MIDLRSMNCRPSYPAGGGCDVVVHMIDASGQIIWVRNALQEVCEPYALAARNGVVYAVAGRCEGPQSHLVRVYP